MSALSAHLAPLLSRNPPWGRVAFCLGDVTVGWVNHATARLLSTLGCQKTASGLVLDNPERLPELAAKLAEAENFKLRGEFFDVRSAPGGPVLAVIDRGALPVFGIAAEGVHLHGLVRRADGLHIWVARRAADKKLDPGKLDHLVAGGIAAGMDAAQTLIKEAEEEAGLPPDLLRAARRTGTLSYVLERPEGLRRDRLHCYELEVPENFTPRPIDGEVAGFELWPAADVLDAVLNTEKFKFNVNLVLLDFFARTGRAARGKNQFSGAPAAIGISRDSIVTASSEGCSSPS
jgi:8-oxo-dGTP pyrophosphatase MutT (NUDIX family)